MASHIPRPLPCARVVLRPEKYLEVATVRFRRQRPGIVEGEDVVGPAGTREDSVDPEADRFTVHPILRSAAKTFFAFTDGQMLTLRRW